MKCAACGYEYQEGTKQQWSKNDGHGGSHSVGAKPFRKTEISQRAPIPGGYGAMHDCGITLYVCPMCGTVRAQ